jgi:hypothetical protein
MIILKVVSVEGLNVIQSKYLDKLNLSRFCPLFEPNEDDRH